MQIIDMEISVIMPVYKVEKYLHQAIDSVLAQTFKDFELIIVDDGSPDNCPAICDEYAAKDSRIKVIHKENGGLSSARNAGLDIAKGKWIAFIDSDDQYKPDMLMKMWTLGEQDELIDYVHCSTEVVSNGFPITKANIEYCTQTFDGVYNLADELILASNVFVWNKLFRASKINSVKLRFPNGLNFEDMFFYNAFASFARKVGFVAEKLYIYNTRQDSIMCKMISGEDVSYVNDHVVIWRRLVDFLRQHGKLQEKENIIFKLLIQCMSIVYNYAPNTAKGIDTNELLSYADIDLNNLSRKGKVDLFWWRRGKPGGGSIKYLGGLVKLQLKENKINVRVFGVKIFSINIDKW